MIKKQFCKFKLTDNKKNHRGRVLYQIKALVDGKHFKKGELGGFVSSAENLSQSGDAWVSGNARILDDAWISGDARISGNARILGDAELSGNATHTVSPLQIQGTRHFLNVDFDADVVYVKIGCMRKTLSDWLKDFSTIGAKDDYTPDQINEYGEYLKLCKSLYGLKLKEKK